MAKNEILNGTFVEKTNFDYLLNNKDLLNKKTVPLSTKTYK